MEHFNKRLLFIVLSALPFGGIYAECKHIDQDDIPFVIKHSGNYQLSEDIVFNGAGSAITINANKVKLFLGTHSITLSDPNGVGIFVNNSSEFEIESDKIENISLAPQDGIGICVTDANKGLIKNVFTVNHFNGLLIQNSTDICVESSQFLDAVGGAAFVEGSTNVCFDSCVFANSGYGLIFTGTNQDCSVLNSEFPSSTFSNLLVQQMNGMMLQNCSFSNVAGDPAKLNLVQFGDALPEQLCNDVIIKNCTIVNRPAHTPTLGNTAPEGLGIYQGSGFLVESCVIDIDNTNQDPAADLSGIHISNPGLGTLGTIASNVMVRNCVVQGPATDGVYPDVGSSGVVIDNCLVTGAQKDGIFLAGTTASTVKNCTVVNNGTNGIFLGEVSVGNSVNNNIVDGNGLNPILSSIPPFGSGIGIASDSTTNSIARNELFNNTINGIDDEGTGNRIFYNTAYANGGLNYFAATDTIIMSNPGDPAKSAENINA
ncbi:MAG: right-handed parallel beta-helix repeat-containing protein [Candidatus Babeliales bacterium]|nr:right-handed parallel beta-helix repeat-containing protein [Candidatus Babeliales bacterium]